MSTVAEAVLHLQQRDIQWQGVGERVSKGFG